MSERTTAHSESPVFGSPSDTSRRVQFQIGMASDVSLQMYEFLLSVSYYVQKIKYCSIKSTSLLPSLLDKIVVFVKRFSL